MKKCFAMTEDVTHQNECTDAKRHGILKGTKILRHYGTKMFRVKGKKAARQLRSQAAKRAMSRNCKTLSSPLTGEDAVLTRVLTSVRNAGRGVLPPSSHQGNHGVTLNLIQGLSMLIGSINIDRLRVCLVARVKCDLVRMLDAFEPRALLAIRKPAMTERLFSMGESEHISCAKRTVKNFSPLTSHFSREGKRYAFTLAETLITLGIIGVVAALTLPTIIQKQNDAATVAKVKKYYSILSQAELMWEQELGCIGDIPACLSNFKAYDHKAFEIIEKQLKILDRVYRGEDTSKKAWLPDSTHRLDGSGPAFYSGVNKKNNNYFAQYLLVDGVILAMEVDTYRQSVIVWIDVNGAKRPNRVGTDAFPMSFGAYNNDNYKGVNPYHGEDNAPGDDGGMCATRNGNICSADDGKSPTAYILTHNKVFKQQKTK